MPRPAPTDAAEYYHKYIQQAKGDSIAEVMSRHAGEIKTFYNALPDAKADYAYAPDKWTLKQLLQHVVDAERVFSYRALRFARKDATPLASFDEKTYADNAGTDERSFQSLKDEFNAVRQSTDIMLSTFNEEQLRSVGTASNNPITVNALAYIIYGHLLHHKAIIEQRYL